MNDISKLGEQPKPGQIWATVGGAEVRIRPSTNPDIIEAKYIDIRCGEIIPVQFDKSGHKITKPHGRSDRLDKHVQRY